MKRLGAYYPGSGYTIAESNSTTPMLLSRTRMNSTRWLPQQGYSVWSLKETPFPPLPSKTRLLKVVSSAPAQSTSICPKLTSFPIRVKTMPQPSTAVSVFLVSHAYVLEQAPNSMSHSELHKSVCRQPGWLGRARRHSPNASELGTGDQRPSRTFKGL